MRTPWRKGDLQVSVGTAGGPEPGRAHGRRPRDTTGVEEDAEPVGGEVDDAPIGALHLLRAEVRSSVGPFNAPVR